MSEILDVKEEITGYLYRMIKNSNVHHIRKYYVKKIKKEKQYPK